MDNFDNIVKNDEIEEIQTNDIFGETPVTLLYVIRDGSLQLADPKKELSKKNFSFRLHSKIPGVGIIDYDKTNIVPIVKDILNRQDQFLEIKLLKILFLCFLVVFAWLGALMYFLHWPWKVDIEPMKAEILASVAKASKDQKQQFEDWKNSELLKNTLSGSIAGTVKKDYSNIKAGKVYPVDENDPFLSGNEELDQKLETGKSIR